MKITTVLFDLDGTLLPMDQAVFARTYFTAIATELVPHGYEFQSTIEGIWAGTGAMMKNDGTRRNDRVFWDTFEGLFGERVKADQPVFDDFYVNKFDGVAASCGYDPRAAEVIRRVKARGLRAVLATNPIFPSIATEKRMGWAGLDPKDFALYTTYENSYHCKPNLEYYRDIMNTLGVCPEACLMVGNDVGEDMIARELGMQVLLLTDCLIIRAGADISVYPHGGFDELLAYVDGLP